MEHVREEELASLKEEYAQDRPFSFAEAGEQPAIGTVPDYVSPISIVLYTLVLD
jgi:hypothetical protein